MLVRAPGLETKPGCGDPFSLLKELARQCLEDIHRGRTVNVEQLLRMLAGAGMERFSIGPLATSDRITQDGHR